MRLTTLRFVLFTGLAWSSAAAADVVADWNDRAVTATLARKLGPPPAERVIAMMHVAMFDAVNAIAPRYRPYLADVPAAPTASKEAAAASAAAAILSGSGVSSEADVKAWLAAALAALPDGESRIEGVRVGEAVAGQLLKARAGDGASAPETYRYAAAPGAYVPTPALFVPQWPAVRPFAMTHGAQFRPGPPVALTSEEWARDFNEIRHLGRIDSSARTADQTAAARFWLAIGGDVYYPLARAIIAARKPDLLDSARLFALVAVARADSLIAVFDAKYHYNFWRPIAAIRNGDRDDNPATEREAGWRPIAETPMHPEYPCAHCVQAASMCAVLEAVLGSSAFDEVAMTSPTAPGIVRRWSDLHAFVDEVSNARIWAGFHYRFSARVGRDMGAAIGAHVVDTLMRPVATATR